MSQREHTNYYEILEVTPDAASSEIHKAYQRARQTYSQDNPALYSMFSQEEARELLRLIDEAYNVLGNQATRKTYDDSLVGKSGGSLGTSSAPVAQPSPSAAAAPRQVEQFSSMSPQAMTSNTPSNVHSMPASMVSPTPMASFDSQNTDEFATKRRELQKAAVPAGQGRTGLSTYKLDESFENEIAAMTEFDGGFIQRVRLYKNISIDKMSDATRISRPYLMAVETNDYKSLPAAVFVRGFVVQAARQLGLDEQKVAASYMKLFKAGGGK